MRARYGRAARRIAATGADSSAFVAQYLSDFDAVTQRRSAMSLGDIRTPAALTALRHARDSALIRGYREDVARVVHLALAAAEATPFAGTLSDSVVGFLDTIVIRRAPGLSWDGDESAVLNGAPFPDSVVTRRYGNDSLALVAAGGVGRYALSVTNLGPSQTTQNAEVLIRSFPALPTRVARDLTGGAFPFALFLSLAATTTPPDTVHYYRFHPATDLQVTAHLAWRGPAQIDLRWEDCAAHTFPGAPHTVAGRVVDAGGHGIAGAQAQLLGTAITGMTSGNGQFQLTTVPAGWQGTLRLTRFGYQIVSRVAAEGQADHWIVLPLQGAPPPPAFAAQTSSAGSPNTASQLIPGGACRLLAVAKRDAQTATVIARLAITSP
jgi:hypothetical protein